MTNKLVILSVVSAIALLTGCTTTVERTLSSVKIDGTKVDYSKLEEYKKGFVCQNRKQTFGSNSIMQAAKKAGVKKIVYVEKQISDSLRCVVVYGK